MRTCSTAVLVAAALGSVRFACGAQADTVARTHSDISAAQTAHARPASRWVWLQSGPPSFDSDKLGGFDGARLVESGVRWQHTLYRAGWFAVATIPDLVTVTSLTRISNQPRIWFYRNDRHSDSVLVRVRSRDGHSVGVGTLPLALRLALDERKPLGVFFDLSAGLQYFSRPIPVDDAARLNAQLMAGGGFRSAIGGRLEGELAYRLVHISNANTADENPGLNFHQIAVAVGFRPRQR